MIQNVFYVGSIIIINIIACCFVWVWKLVVDTARGKEAECVWEQGIEEIIWTKEGRGKGGMEEIA